MCVMADKKRRMDFFRGNIREGMLVTPKGTDTRHINTTKGKLYKIVRTIIWGSHHIEVVIIDDKGKRARTSTDAIITKQELRKETLKLLLNRDVIALKTCGGVLKWGEIYRTSEIELNSDGTERYRLEGFRNQTFHEALFLTKEDLVK